MGKFKRIDSVVLAGWVLAGWLALENSRAWAVNPGGTPINGATGQQVVDAGTTQTHDGLRRNQVIVQPGDIEGGTFLIVNPAEGETQSAVIIDNRTINDGSGTPGLTIGEYGSMDITNNHLILFYMDDSTDPNPWEQIIELLNNEYFGNSPQPRLFSQQYLDSSGEKILVAVDNTRTMYGDTVNSYFDLFLGDSAEGNNYRQIIVKLALPGDYNLDGVVNAADYQIVNTYRGSLFTNGIGGWIFGDGNLDGVVNEEDAALVTQFLDRDIRENVVLGGSPNPLIGVTPIPEPSWLMGASLAMVGGLWIYVKKRQTTLVS
ncbi:MAG: dockerin type I repeat-containing protein [Pirellulales bacterium]|nr:dockerin type I repeat-containing protein [Pirellulales bacterium]